MRVFCPVVAVTVASAAAVILALLPSLASVRLSVVEHLVNGYYSTTVISAAELQTALHDAKPLLLFDVRTTEEYEVSHLPNAIQLNPQLSADEFLNKFGQVIDGKQLIFYCSVGQRSGAFTDKIHDIYRHHDKGRIANLRGGIFRWATIGLPMENHQGDTSVVHPYSAAAAKLLPPAVRKSRTANSTGS